MLAPRLADLFDSLAGYGVLALLKGDSGVCGWAPVLEATLRLAQEGRIQLVADSRNP